MNIKSIFKIAPLCLSIALGMIVLATPSAQAAPAAQTTAQNPIIWADVPDLDVIRVGNRA